MADVDDGLGLRDESTAIRARVGSSEAGWDPAGLHNLDPLIHAQLPITSHLTISLPGPSKPKFAPCLLQHSPPPPSPPNSTWARRCFSSRRLRTVVVGKLLRGMSTTVEMPPAAAAVVPVTMPEADSSSGKAGMKQTAAAGKQG